MATSDAVAREVAWLTTSGDGLPALLSSASGPWQVVQSYWPRTPATRQTGIYLLRTSFHEQRFSNQRKLVTHHFRGKLVWPIGATTTAAGIWETEQAAFDSAVDLLLRRVRGFVGDKTHGGRFLSVAEAPESTGITVHFDDPEHTSAASPAMLLATITYAADDADFTA